MDYFFLGDDELVAAFRSIGVNGMTVYSEEEAVDVFTRITQTGKCQILILTEETADWLGENIVEWQLSGRYPLIVEIPGIMGRLEGRKTLVDSIREAIGIHI